MRGVRLDELVGRKLQEVLSAHPGDFSRNIPGVTLSLEVGDQGQLLALQFGEELSRQPGVALPVLLRPMP